MPAEFAHRVYAGRGHGFLPQWERSDEPDDDDDDDPGQSWRLTLAHFERHLGTG